MGRRPRVSVDGFLRENSEPYCVSSFHFHHPVLFYVAFHAAGLELPSQVSTRGGNGKELLLFGSECLKL